MALKTSSVPMIDSDGNRINTIWTYYDDGEVLAWRSIETDDHRQIVRSGETFVYYGSDKEVRIVSEPAEGPRGNVAGGWPLPKQV